MTAAEVAAWQLYCEKHGPLNNGARIEQAAALICTVAAQLAGNKNAKISDFLPQRDSSGGFATPEQIARMFGAQINGK